MDPAILSVLESKLDSIHIPSDEDKVYKEECIYSLASNQNHNHIDDDGIYICLNKFWAFSRSYMKEYSKNTQNFVFLRIRRTKGSSKMPAADEPSPPTAKIGGTDDTESNTQSNIGEEYDLIIMPEFHSVPLPNYELPQKILDSVAAIKAKQSASITDLVNEESPAHLEMNGKQYTSEDSVFQEFSKAPLELEPVFITKWYGKSQRNNYYNNSGNNARGGGGGRSSGGHSGGGGNDGNRKDGTHFRPWR